jgi:hypothetical protein
MMTLITMKMMKKNMELDIKFTVLILNYEIWLVI